MNRVEHATVTSRRPDPELSAAVSLARAAGVPVAVAAQQLRNGTARMLIEARVAPRKVEAGHLERMKRLADLKVREVVLFGGG